jgi:hypothetical protein
MKWPFSRNRNETTQKPRRSGGDPARDRDADAHLPFHAVEIVSNGPRCAAARAIEQERFLSRTGPPALPLAGCTRSESCSCRYRHHADRRGDTRRVADQIWGAQVVWPPERERRRSRGRRATDGRTSR